MIDELQVNDYALIAKAYLEFAPGFTVLTGETGAGKTALVGAIKLLIGERADITAISEGSDELRVSARLLAADGTETVISRRLNRQGRSRAAIDDELVSVAALAKQVGPRFDLLGQHEHQSLLSSSAQLLYLDQAGGSESQAALAAYQQAWQAQQAAAAWLAGLEAAAEQDSQDLADASFLVSAIDTVGPLAGEYEQLEAELPILRRGEDLATGADTAWQLLRSEGQALDLLAQAGHSLAALKGVDSRLDGLAARLESAQIDLEDLSAELVAYRDSVSFDAEALSRALDRIGQLEGLTRRFGPSMADVLERYDQAQQRLALAVELPERLAEARQQMEVAEASLVETAGVLGALRAAAAASLAARLNSRLPELAFGGATIEARLGDLPRSAWGQNGAQSFELLFSPHAGAQPRPLAKIASGGELSRVMLALKTELLSDEGLTLVFDEVDAGIGGQAARAVAVYLRQLADIHQVIVVTHLAQIAAVADRHYVVAKQSQGESQSTSITEVSAEERVRELARMLSGSEDDIALAHARELLAGG